MASYSVYFTPNKSVSAFRNRLGALEEEIRNTEGRVLVGGHFNASALECGMPQLDSRITQILEMTAKTELINLNIGSIPTFQSPDCKYGKCVEASSRGVNEPQDLGVDRRNATESLVN